MANSFKDKYFPTISLFAICLVTTFLLALVYGMTKDTIDVRAAEDAASARRSVMAAADRFEPLDGEETLDPTAVIQAVYGAYAGDDLIGYAYDAVTTGYGGDVKSIVGVTVDDLLISGLRVTQHKETSYNYIKQRDNGCQRGASNHGGTYRERSRSMSKALNTFKNGIVTENPVLRLVLGTCPTLAVTTAAINGIGMGLATMAVLTASNILISLLRNVISDKVRIPSYVVIIAGFTTIVQLLMQAYLPSIYTALGIYIPLIVVNCIILGRAESFASKN